MKKVSDILQEQVAQALGSCGFEGVVNFEHPADLSHGDFSCNVALTLAKEAGKNPRELAEEIVAALPESDVVEKVEVAGPGFINFFLSEKFFVDTTTAAVAQQDEWGPEKSLSGKTILFEHSSPNLFKPFHIGHLVNNTLGESLVRLLRASGASVVALSYPSDVSPGIAKAVWAIIDNGWQDDITIERIGEAYVHGVAAYDADESTKQRIDEINASLYRQEKDTPEWAVYEKGKEISLAYFTEMTEKLGSTFDHFFFESEAEEEGKRIVREHTPGVFEESDGAIIFRGSEHGLFDNVFINSAGFGTYLAKDIGLLDLKFAAYQSCDMSVTVTDTEQKHHFQLVKKAAEFINKEWAEKSEYIQHGRLQLTSGKISSRAGNVPLADDIISSVEERARERMRENDRADDEVVARQIAIGAIKYAIARVSMGKNITFGMEQALSFEGDSGPYLQYTHARACSVLEKGEYDPAEPAARGNMERTDVERLLYRFPEAVERAVEEYEPHYIANFLNDLASAFNSWYAHEQIVDGSEGEKYKLALTHAVAVTLKRGLWMLGIEAPEKM